MSKSAVNQHFVAVTKKQLKTRLEASLEGFDIKAVMLDGIHLATHLVVIVVGMVSGVLERRSTASFEMDCFVVPSSFFVVSQTYAMLISWIGFLETWQFVVL